MRLRLWKLLRNANRICEKLEEMVFGDDADSDVTIRCFDEYGVMPVYAVVLRLPVGRGEI